MIMYTNGYEIEKRVAVLPISYVDGGIAVVAIAGLGLGLGQSYAEKAEGNKKFHSGKKRKVVLHVDLVMGSPRSWLQ